MAAPRTNRRADRIRTQIPILEVLHALGYQVHPGAGDREQQFPCDLHGDGRDGKPSARVYPSSNSWYCFACSTTRDSLRTVRDKMGLPFGQACDWLEKGWKLGPLPWEEEEELPDAAPTKQPGRETWEAESGIGTFAESRDNFRVLCQDLTKERWFSMSETMAIWEVFDQICWMVAEGKQWDDTKGRDAIQKLHQRVFSKLRERMSTHT